MDLSGKKLLSSSLHSSYYILCLFFKRYYLFVTQRETAQTGGVASRGRGRLPLSKKPEVELSSRTLGT